LTVPKAISDSTLLSTSQVAEKLGVHRTTVWLWIKNGALRAERHGAFHGVTPSALSAFLRIYKIQPKPKSKKKSAAKARKKKR